MEDIEKLQQDFQLLKREVDSLQVEVMKGEPPWYRNGPIIVSMLALLFSFGTTYVSNERIESQDLLAKKSELRGMLQQLGDLPKENFELIQKYENNPNALAFLGGQLNQENSLLTSQAEHLLSTLPLGAVSAIEAYSVGTSLQAAGEMQRAREMFFLAVGSAINMNDAVAAMRGVANTSFALGELENGRLAFAEALSAFSKFEGHNEFVEKTTHITTLLGWHSAEAAAGFMESARERLEKAKGIAATLPPGPGTDQWQKQIDQAIVTLESVTGA